MKVIWKYKIDMESIKVPKNSKVLCVQLQNDLPHVWMLVDTEEKEFDKRQFMVIGTGSFFHNKYMEYVCTYQEGIFVWHVFEKI